MNDQKIFECLSQLGAANDVELAIWLGTSTDDIYGQMAALISVGDVKIETRVDRSFYVFTERFKATDEYAKLKRRADLLQFQQDPLATTPEAKATHYMLANGRQATSAELHAVLGLGADDLPSAVLADALAEGRMFRDGKRWFLDRRSEVREPAALLEEDLDSKPMLRQQVAWPSPSTAKPITTVVAPPDHFGLLPRDEAPKLTITKRHDRTVLVKAWARSHLAEQG